MVTSALYRGTVRHRRYSPVEHGFSFPLFMVYLNLGEIDAALERGWLCSARGPALARFRREDHLGDASMPLDEAVRDLVLQKTGQRPAGPITLLTHLRYFGYLMNPLAVYYCFDAAGTHVEHVVLEVTNTPWREQHAYVLARGGGLWRDFQKTLHVSPFMPMEQEYRARLGTPGKRLVVHLENWQQDGRPFDATLALKRGPLDSRSLAGHLLRFPFMTVQVALGIYFQALRLWWNGAPLHAHPPRA